MSDQTTGARASILFDGPVGLDFIGLVNELQLVLRNLAFDVDETAVAQGSHLVFLSEGMVLRVGHARRRINPDILRKASRPTSTKVSTAMRDALLEQVRASVEVSAEPGPGRPLPERTLVAACYHVTRHLMRRHHASLVHWHQTGTLFTDTEFETPGFGNAPQPRRPEPGKVKRHSVRPTLSYGFAEARPPAFTATEIETPGFGNAPQPRRPEPGKVKRHSERPTLNYGSAEARPPARDAASTQAVTAELATVPAQEVAAEPATAPAPHHPVPQEDTLRAQHAATSREEERLRSMRGQICASDLIESKDSRRGRPDVDVGLVEQLAVYVMTVTVMFLSFPVGFVLLIYNVMRGENLKVTARAMSITGTAAGFMSLYGEQALSLLL